MCLWFSCFVAFFFFLFSFFLICSRASPFCLAEFLFRHRQPQTLRHSPSSRLQKLIQERSPGRSTVSFRETGAYSVLSCLSRRRKLRMQDWQAVIRGRGNRARDTRQNKGRKRKMCKTQIQHARQDRAGFTEHTERHLGKMAYIVQGRPSLKIYGFLTSRACSQNARNIPTTFFQYLDVHLLFCVWLCLGLLSVQFVGSQEDQGTTWGKAETAARFLAECLGYPWQWTMQQGREKQVAGTVMKLCYGGDKGRMVLREK